VTLDRMFIINYKYEYKDYYNKLGTTVLILVTTIIAPPPTTTKSIIIVRVIIGVQRECLWADRKLLCPLGTGRVKFETFGHNTK